MRHLALDYGDLLFLADVEGADMAFVIFATFFKPDECLREKLELLHKFLVRHGMPLSIAFPAVFCRIASLFTGSHPQLAVAISTMEHFSSVALLHHSLLSGCHWRVLDVITLCSHIASANPRCGVLHEKGLLSFIARLTGRDQIYSIQEAATVAYLRLIGGGCVVAEQSEVGDIETVVKILKALHGGLGEMRLSAQATFRTLRVIYNGKEGMRPVLDEFSGLFDEETVVSS
jgi:hypothetical protein